MTISVFNSSRKWRGQAKRMISPHVPPHLTLKNGHTQPQTKLDSCSFAAHFPYFAQKEAEGGVPHGKHWVKLPFGLFACGRSGVQSAQENPKLKWLASFPITPTSFGWGARNKDTNKLKTEPHGSFFVHGFCFPCFCPLSSSNLFRRQIEPTNGFNPKYTENTKCFAVGCPPYRS